MAAPTDRKYTKSHEWARKIDGGLVEIGVTQHAADQLTDITFVELPAVGDRVSAGTAMGEIESVKSASDLYAPVSGEVAEVNQALADQPGSVNEDPFGAGWMVRVSPSDESELDALLDADAYARIAD
jgi:glycine cleavage system H protein